MRGRRAFDGLVQVLERDRLTVIVLAGEVTAPLLLDRSDDAPRAERAFACKILHGSSFHACDGGAALSCDVWIPRR